MKKIHSLYNRWGATAFELYGSKCFKNEFPYINTNGIISFEYAWQYCVNCVQFPRIDTSNGTLFNFAWTHCSKLRSFPNIDVSNGNSFTYAWSECYSLVEFPPLKFKNATTFASAWNGCTNLKHFPPNMFDDLSGEMDHCCFLHTWLDCKLNAQSVENILVSIDKANIVPFSVNNDNQTIDLSIEKYTVLTQKTLDAIKSLKSKYWVVLINA